MERPQPASHRNEPAWVVTDGHAGNVRQAMALSEALQRPAREWTVTARAPWRWWAPRRLPAVEHAWTPPFRDALARPPALAIGCGRQGALATRVLGSRGSRTVQILDPRIDPRHWDVVVVPEHDRLRGDNVVTSLGSLHPVDAAWLACAREAHASFGALPSPRVALLVGGPSTHAAFALAALVRFAETVAALVRDAGGSILLTTSRRTPMAAAEPVRAAFDGLPGVRWSAPADGVNPYAGLLGWAERIVCTADSVNMLSEAAATTAPLYVAGVDAVRGRPRRFVDALLASGRARALPARDASLDDFAVQPLRETARVAEAVRRRLALD